MKITFEKQGDIRILPMFTHDFPEDVQEDTKNWLQESGNFTGKLGETYVEVKPGTENMILVGLGPREKFDYDALRTMSFKALETVTKLNIEKANFIVPEMEELADPLALKAILKAPCKTITVSTNIKPKTRKYKNRICPFVWKPSGWTEKKPFWKRCKM